MAATWKDLDTCDMNVFVIPSWYPTSDHPYTGIFIRQQVLAIASLCPEANIGICTWGSHINDLLLEVAQIHKWPGRIWRAARLQQQNLAHRKNCREYFTPAFTWTRSILGGNMGSIIQACEANFTRFAADFGTPHLFHAHVAYPAGFIARHLSLKTGIPYIITEHMSPFPFTTFLTSGGKLRKELTEPYENAKRNIAVSSSLAAMMKAQRIPRVEVIPNLVDETFFSSAAASSQPPFTFVFIGRLEPQKGLPYLLEAMALLKSRNLACRLVVGGGGSGMSELRKQAWQLGITENVEWLGDLSQEGVREVLQKAHALILPSLHENNPLVILEAMATGRPVIATRCNGPEELMSPETGLLVEPGSGPELAGAMQHLIQRYATYSPTLIREQFLASYSRPAVVPRLLKVYREVASEPGW